MLGTVILSVFILLVVFLIFVEYRNEKKYQQERRESRDKQTRNRTSAPSKVSPKAEPAPKKEPKPEPKPTPKVEVKEEPKPEPKAEVKVEPKPEPKPAPKVEVKEEPKPEPIIEIAKEEVKEAKALPEAKYPPFTHVRLVEMGLSDEEAKEFVSELIPQLEEQIPLIEEAMSIPDFHQMERLTHSIKGSATNIGTGGVSDLLVACNTYLKTGNDIDIAKAYFEHLKHYTKELKEQYA